MLANTKSKRTTYLWIPMNSDFLGRHLSGFQIANNKSSGTNTVKTLRDLLARAEAAGSIRVSEQTVESASTELAYVMPFFSEGRLLWVNNILHVKTLDWSSSPCA